jgi:hypothetical protein
MLDLGILTVQYGRFRTDPRVCHKPMPMGMLSNNSRRFIANGMVLVSFKTQERYALAQNCHKVNNGVTLVIRDDFFMDSGSQICISRA